MKTKSLIWLRVLINRYNAKAGQALLKFLPEDERQSVLNQNIHSTDVLPLLMQPQQLMERVHYSWIQPLLEKFPKEIHSILIASLTPEQISGLQHHLSVSPTPSVSVPVKTFMLHQLYTLLTQDPPLPLEYLAESEFSPLATWNKSQLVNLIDFLGIHDLAADIRRIVSKLHLDNLTSCLTPQQQYYLKVCLHQKEQLVPPKLDINPAVKDCKKLKMILHQRGLIRLGKALAGQQMDLMTMIAYRLDVGRGRWLLHYYRPSPILHVTPVLKLQVTNLMNFIKKGKL